MRLLVTGGAGFIGSNFVRYAIKRWPDCRIVVLDALTYAGNLTSLEDVLTSGRVAFVQAEIQDRKAVGDAISKHGVTHAVNFAAETHNDRSILDSGSFIQTDVYGVYCLLECVREAGVERLLHVSTDEVYGSIDQGDFNEGSPLEPNTPYSASKAGGDLQVRAHVVTFKTPALITRGGNTYGPFQYPEKLIPFFITRMIDGKMAPLYGEGEQVREWLHVDDHCSGIAVALEDGEVGQTYNLGDDNERTNRQVVELILDELGLDWDLVKKIEDPRGGAHDKRYSMDCSKLRALGWQPQVEFESGLRETVAWYRKRQDWWRPVVAKPAYQRFVERFYGPYLGEDL